MFNPTNVEVNSTSEFGQPTARRRWLILSIVVALLFLLASFVVFLIALKSFRSETTVKWNEIHIGDTEETVRALLGKPTIEHTRQSAPVDYYVTGYRRRERPITHRVLIYLGADLVLYVWIDASGSVEDIFMGVS